MAEKRTAIPAFIAGSTSSRYQALDGDILSNASVIPAAGATSRNSAALIPRAGLIQVFSANNIRWGYASYTLGRQLIIVGNELRAYDLINSTEYEVVNIPINDLTSRPYITDTFTGCVISVDGLGYSIDKDTLAVTAITGANWANPSSLWFVDGYTLLSVKNSRFFNYSDLNSTTFENALLTAGTAGDVDNIGSLAVINREVYIFGDKHTEIWWNSPVDVNTVFVKQDGRVFAQGILSVNTVVVNGVGYNACRGDSAYGIFAWAGQAQKISVGAVDVDLENCKTCRMMNSFERNRSFIHVLIDESKLWSYDVGSQTWHVRTYPGKIIDMFKVDGHHYLALDTGVHILDGNTDNGVNIESYKQTSHIHAMGYWMFHELIEFDVGGAVAELRLDFSDDGGITWRNASFSSNARVGEFNRYRFHRLGRSRDRVYRLNWSTNNAAGIYYSSETFNLGVK
jgi:hypothetical protein